MTTRKLTVVTGGAGFIGSHMVDLLLDEGFRVHVIDNLSGGSLQNLKHQQKDPHLVVEEKDIRDVEPEDSFFQKADYIFHFAGIGDIVPSIDRPVDYLSTNVMGTIKILEVAGRLKSKKWFTLHLHPVTDLQRKFRLQKTLLFAPNTPMR